MNPEFGEAVLADHAAARSDGTYGRRETAVTGISGYRTIMDAYSPDGAAWPAGPVDLCFWLSYICRKPNMQVETAASYVSAVKKAHLTSDPPLPWLPNEYERDLVADHLDAMYHLHGRAPVKEKQQVNPLAVRMFCKHLPSTHKWRLFKFVAHIMSYRGRRGGECLTTSLNFPNKHVLASHLTTQEQPPGHRLALFDVKNYKDQTDYSAFYPALPGDITDLQVLMADYISNSPIKILPESFLFMQDDGTPLDAPTFYRWTTEAFGIVGLRLRPGLKIGASSYRAGVATESARIGFNTSRIQQIGDWKAAASVDFYAQLNDFDVADSVQQLATASATSLRRIEAIGIESAEGAAAAARLVPAFAAVRSHRRRRAH